MNRLLTATAVAAILAVSASAASAQEPTANIKITANEPVVCGFFPPAGTPGPGVGTGAFVVSNENDLHNIELKGDAADFVTQTELQVEFEAFCNTAFELSASTDNGGKLVNGDAPSGTSLVTELPYNFRLRTKETDIKDNFAPPSTSPTVAPNISSLPDINEKINITIFPDSVIGIRYAGDFVDTIRLEIGPKMAPSS